MNIGERGWTHDTVLSQDQRDTALRRLRKHSPDPNDYEHLVEVLGLDTVLAEPLMCFQAWITRVGRQPRSYRTADVVDAWAWLGAQDTGRATATAAKLGTNTAWSELPQDVDTVVDPDTGLGFLREPGGLVLRVEQVV